jgi:hypothetical protein
VQSRSENALGLSHRQKEILNLSPAGNPPKTGNSRIMGSGEEDSLAFESLQVPERVVDQVVGVQDALVSAENEVGRRDEGKWRRNHRYLGPKELGNSMAAVAIKIS